MPDPTLEQRLTNLTGRLERLAKHLEAAPTPRTAPLLRRVDVAKAEVVALASEAASS